MRLSYYHAYNSLYAQIIIAFLDELGKDENYTEIHKYASGALIMLDGSPRICFWLTVADYCEKWLKMRSATIRPTTLKNHEKALGKHIIKPIGHMYMDEVTTDDLRWYCFRYPSSPSRYTIW